MFPKLRFQEFDGAWSNSKIDDIAVVTSGGTPSRSNLTFWDGNIPWVTTSLVDFNIIQSAEEFITQKGLDNSSAKLFPKNTILMAMYGQGITRGKVAILGIDATTNQACAAIKLQSNYDTQFIFQNLMSRYEEIRDLSNDGGQKNLSAGIIKEIEVYYPEKTEQIKIASFLSVVDEKISQFNQKHELLSQYKQGMMQKLFSQQIRFKADDGSEFREWEETRFLDLMVDLWDYRGKTPKKLGMDWGDGEIQSLSALNVKKGFIDFDADCHLGSEKLYTTWMNKGDLEKGDIIFTMEAPLGNVALIPDGRKYILSQRVVCFKTNKKMVDNKFIFQLILSDQFQSRIEELATGTTAKGINQKSMQKIQVGLPSKDEQTKIANFLSAIDQKIEMVTQQIEQAKQWKKGLLQQMFI